MERRVVAFSTFLALSTVAATTFAVVLDLRPPGDPSWSWLPLLALSLAAAEHWRVRFRRGDDVDAVTLFEAVLAPLIFAFSAPVVAGTVAIAQLVTAGWRRTAWVKAMFNITMWSLAATVGSVVLGALSAGTVGQRLPLESPLGLPLGSLAFLVVALTCVAVVNNAAFTCVLSISSQRSWRSVLSGLAPVIGPGWVAGWAMNLLMGLLFTLAYTGHPVSVLLFPVPLAMLHFAYRGYAAARVDRLRLTGLQEAAHALAEPLDPRLATDGFLRAAAEGFEARAAALVVRAESGDYETQLLVVAGTEQAAGTAVTRRATELERRLAGRDAPLRLAAGSDPLARLLALEGWRDCVCAPLADEGRQTGAVVVFDLAGLEGTARSDLAVLAALARETAHTFARGRLFESVLEERRKLDQIVTTASDGILTLGEDGAVLSWNLACERITGLPRQVALGRTDTFTRLDARTASGAAVDFREPAADPALPRDVLITTVSGQRRRLSCSVSPAGGGPGDPARFVVVARDVTPAEEYEELRQQLDQLVEVEAAQRLVVEHLQRAVAPGPPTLDGVDVAVTYVASDPASPTGGDLYDWQLLPSGELHVAVVDVLGHGVHATKSAVTVIHALRFLTVQGVPLEDVVCRTDAMLSAQRTGLVASVVVARYDPSTGQVRVVSGGHPPALVVHTDGRVTELEAAGCAIGWPAAGSEQSVNARLEEGESLVLYTDGLIEARRDILVGMAALTRHASEAAHLPVASYADELVSRSLAGADRRDDSLALVLRRSGAPASGRRVPESRHVGVGHRARS